MYVWTGLSAQLSGVGGKRRDKVYTLRYFSCRDLPMVCEERWGKYLKIKAELLKDSPLVG